MTSPFSQLQRQQAAALQIQRFGVRWLATALPFVLLMSGCASLQAPPQNTGPKFTFPRDTFAFANETVLNYRDGAQVADDRNTPPKYSRCCFVMAAAAAQFWKSARFEPAAPPVSRAELARRIHRVVRRGTWAPILPAEQRIVFPGYKDLWDFSTQEPALLQKHMGAGWKTYLHPHKYAMQCVPAGRHQERIRQAFDDYLAAGHVMVVWLYNFPGVNINHAVVVFAREDTDTYLVYDPNYTDRPRRLDYDSANRQFSFEPTFYFPGGDVKVRAVYLNALH